MRPSFVSDSHSSALAASPFWSRMDTDYLVGVAELAEGTGAPAMAEGERELLENPGRFAPSTIALLPYSPDVLLSGASRSRWEGSSSTSRSVPGHSPPTSRTTRRALSSQVMCCSPARSVDADLPGADWETLLASIRSLVDAFPPETVVYPGHGPATTLGDELARNPFLVELRTELAE